MTGGIERRDFIRSAGLLAGAATVVALIESPALALSTSNPRFSP